MESQNNISLALTIGREGASGVSVFNQTHQVRLSLPRWELALEFAHILAYQARGIYPPESHTVSGASIKRDGKFEIISLDGAVFAVMPLEMAQMVSNEVIAKAREIETEESFDEVIFDQAILNRTNFIPNLGLVSGKHWHSEANKVATWDSKLRRYIRGGVKRQRIVSSPTVVKGT